MNSEIQINQYYRYVGDDEKEAGRFDEGLVLVAALDEDGTVHFVSGETAFTEDFDAFLLNFELTPNGAIKRSVQIQVLLEEMNQEQAELSLSSVALSLPGEQQQNAESNGSRALTALADKSKLAKMKQAIKRGEYQVKRTATQLQTRMERIQSLMAERKEAMDIQIAQMNKVIKKLEEAVWTINLYLGTDETIVQLQRGEPAPACEKIAIRQLVLWMAEECAVASESGGIDVRSMEEFDKWIVASPKHLDQVLPEPKGIVALKITKIEKPTGDRFYDSALREANRHTYFLMRNGANVYRIDNSTLEVYGSLLPSQSEFDRLFHLKVEEFNWKTHEYETKEYDLRPGTDQYEKAMQNVEAMERHYMRILLFIQGLLDRTEIFKPYPWAAEQINVMDRKNNKDFMTYIYDAENLLGTGRLSFRDWIEELNSKLDVGHRIIGAFGSFSATNTHIAGKRYSGERPDSLELYTLERKGKRDDEFVFLYKQTTERYLSTGSWYSDMEYRTPKNRASCRIFKGDRFILNIDDAEIEDMEYYLANRTDRHEFVDMFPVLKTAIQIKKREAKQEAPFRKLLIGQMVQSVSNDFEHAEAQVDELIKWWKLKNKTHRALTSNDSLALSMIVQEYRLRIEKEQKRRAGAARFERFAKALSEANDQIIYIGHKNNNECVVLIPENDQNIFVQEETWAVDRSGKAAFVESKRWRTIDKRRLRWLDLFTTARWREWSYDVRAINYLTDEERDGLLESVWKKIEKTAKEQGKSDPWNHKPKNPVYLPLVATIDKRQQIRVYCCYHLGFIDDKHPATGRHEKPAVFRYKVTWKREAGIAIFEGDYYHGINDVTYSPDDRYWEGRYAGDQRVFWRNEDNLIQLDSQFTAFEPTKAERERINGLARNIAKQVYKAITERRLAVEHMKFMAEIGDESLWPTHLAGLKLKEISWSYAVERAACYVLEQRESITGMTLQELFTLACEFGCKEELPENSPDDLILDERFGEKSETQS